MRSKLTLILLALILPLVLAFGMVSAQDQNVIRYPITVDPEHLNPFIADTISIGTVNRNIYEGLTRYNAETGAVEPAIAESWTISEDGLVFTFSIRQGVLFHDIAGVTLTTREVTANDILWNYMVALNGDQDTSIRASELDFILGAPEYTTAYRERLEAGEELPLILEDVEVPGLRVLDDYTFEIELSAADRLFIINGMVSITSPEAYEQLGEAFNSTPVGTGPYQFVEWLRQDRLVLAANPDYYIAGLPMNDGIRFINYGDANTALLDYREDNVDFLFSFPSGQRDSVIAEFSDDFNEKPGLHVRYWGFNMADGYLADKPLVRLAMAVALDRETAWDIFDQGARFPALLGMLPPSMPASNPATVYDFNIDRAAELLAEAGFPGGEGLETVNIYLLESIAGEAQVVVWAEALETLGIPFEFIIEDGSTYWGNIVTDRADVFTNGWAAGLVDPSDVFDYLILDGNGSMRYDNPAVNELLRAARVELDETVRAELYQQAHDIIMADTVVIPSAYSKVSWLQKPWVSGFAPGGGGTYTAPLWNVVLSR